MRVSSAVGKSERIKTHQCSFYAPNLKEHVMQQWGSMDKVRIPKTRPSEPTPPDSPLGDCPTAEHDAISTYIPIGPRPPGATPLFKWIHPQSQKLVHVVGRGPSTGD
ncbi:hypothetical protein M9H77_17880 [Catharanthus roseus]|uniref:Uncharacterized protein n=1 Tax=Catharanthus roseus TaxID=4058 RepID=A0ACC0B5V2_CATRO|nr:hypothetical protein M9H77_17880 [Catharanthus roseus]